MDPVVKQQASERIRTANEILVTVSANPSVDQLAAAIGTTLLLNKLGKHATAIFSGQTPSTLEFLQPEKTIEHNIDNLRDFIISLDKAKADKLHFKVEDDIVRIYITPYKTSLSQTDLSYSQGDYNIEVILALGVQNRNQIDQALAAHGRILHDATIIAVTAGKGKPSDVGQINWQDPAASSLCEMMMSISESFGSGLIDAQMATAFLTGIVAETERFRNPKTTPKVMTMSAQLMAAGANQQLIASKLELPEPAAPAAPKAAAGPSEGTIKLDHAADKPAAPKPASPEVKPTAAASASPAEPQAEPISLGADEINIDAEGNVSTLSKPKFIPAPPDFKPPESLPQAAASAPLPPPSPAKPLADDIPLPGEHTLLDPNAHQPTLDTPLSADTQPAWKQPGETPPISAVVGTEEEKQKNAIDEARAAVEAAASASAPTPAVPDQPTQATPAPAPTPTPTPAPDAPAAPSAPPVPPPLPGSVIDAASSQNPPQS